MAILKDRDGNKAEILLKVERFGTIGPDFSGDFYEVGSLPEIEETETGEAVYLVEDVAYCIEQAEDWKNSTGDFWDYQPEEGEQRLVYVTRY